MALLEQCAHQAPGCLSCLDLGKVQNTNRTESVPLWGTQEPEQFRLGKCTKCRARFGQCSCRAPWSLSSVDPENKHCKPDQTQCGPYTVSTPHTWQPTRSRSPWGSLGKNTGVGCHFLLLCMKVKMKLLSGVRLLATPWTAAYQAPPSLGFSRIGVPLPSPISVHKLA